MMSKREFDPAQFLDTKPKKKKSRWGAETDDKAILAGLALTVPADLTKEQEQQLIVQVQIEEISRRLRTGELGIHPNPEMRSPSPEPIYNNEGKRLNTREFRTRKKLEETRHELVQKAIELNSEYKPPLDYRPPSSKITDKVWIPQEEHPEINFVGLLIGPRGNTLKMLEKDTGAKIIIRGKGSVKEGKIGRKDGLPMPGEDEPLHAYITATTVEHVKIAVDKIKEIIRQGIEVPEEDNDLRKQQLRELALLNGTLREGDALSKLRQFAESQTIITNTIICTVCGGAGHIAADCKQKRPGDSFRGMMNAEQPPPSSFDDRAKMDTEYMSLMAELGQAPPPKPDVSSYSGNRPFRPLSLPPPRGGGGAAPYPALTYPSRPNGPLGGGMPPMMPPAPFPGFRPPGATPPGMGGPPFAPWQQPMRGAPPPWQNPMGAYGALPPPPPPPAALSGMIDATPPPPPP